MRWSPKKSEENTLDPGKGLFHFQNTNLAFQFDDMKCDITANIIGIIADFEIIDKLLFEIMVLIDADVIGKSEIIKLITAILKAMNIINCGMFNVFNKTVFFFAGLLFFDAIWSSKNNGEAWVKEGKRCPILLSLADS